MKDREYRYQSIRDLALDLRAYAREMETPSPNASAESSSSRPAWILWSLLIASVLGVIATLILRTRSDDATAPRMTMQRITSHGRVGHLATSSDGRFVAFTTSDERGQSIALEQIATGSSVTVARPEPLRYYSGLAFSGDAFDQSPAE